MEVDANDEDEDMLKEMTSGNSGSVVLGGRCHEEPAGEVENL